MAERQTRPSPEALLDTAEKEGRGRLKIFLGAAPGVGKTYEMLQSAQAKRREGVDVVVGVVETHGRRETEADSILDQADDIEIVDIAPDDLIQRLHEGKVYVPHHAERAVRHYFQPGILTALRELALRRTAQRVDDQLLSHMQAHAIAGPWAAGDRILVCISEHGTTAGLIRYARRIADRLHAPWTAIYIEAARTYRLNDAERDRVAEHLRLAERLGASTITIPGRNIAEEVIAYAEANNITQILIGKSDRPRWFEILHGSVVHELVRKAGSISVHVISANEGEPVAPKTVATRPGAEPFRPGAYIGSAAAVVLALGIGSLIERFIGLQSISLVFL